MSIKILCAALFTLFLVLMSGCSKSDDAASSPDTTAPVVSIVSPTSNSMVPDTVVIQANTTDNVGVSKVEFYVDGSLHSTRSTAPWEYRWLTNALATNSSHVILVKGYDAANNIGSSPTITVTKSPDTTPPTVSITTPANNSMVVDSVFISVNAIDNVGVQKVEFYIDGILVNSRSTAPWEYKWRVQALPPTSSHSIQAKAYDASTNIGSSQVVAVSVNRSDNTSPTVTITSPASNATVTDSALVTVDATDNVGVQKVELYVDGVLSSTRLSAPWTFKWVVTGLPINSSHSIQAKAYDAASNVGLSQSMTLISNRNQALYFDGAGDFVRLPSSSSLTSFGNQITVEAWVRISVYGVSGGVILNSGSENEYGFGIYPNGKLGVTMVRVNPQVNHAFIGRTTLALNTWYHVAFTYNGSTESIYVNGALDSSFTASGSVSTTQYNENISIGAYCWNDFANQGTFLQGTVDEVRVWNINRTQAQIQSTMGSLLVGSEIGLVGYWNMDGNVTDRTANANHGTIYGNPGFVVR